MFDLLHSNYHKQLEDHQIKVLLWSVDTLRMGERENKYRNFCEKFI
jgi:hypothetical protein